MIRGRSGAAIPWLLALSGLYWFASSFFLAKRSLAETSHCEDAPKLLQLLGLSSREIEPILNATNGCWMPRSVDSAKVIVVDALRFDFAQYHFPKSFGLRLNNVSQRIGHSQLLQFVADPPTVTMQRLKALTTGGLPTFADISNNFGGGTVEDDSWVQLIVDVDYRRRGLAKPPQTAFVGDDTWLDLFPTQFTHAYPYPSFNTRDLDTVDNGCLQHIPQLLQSNLEVLVVHFLGVDHVGHTYGPNNQYMDSKLAQMDGALSHLLQTMDNATSCQVAFIFGDHGMTADGNHGGGTEEEITAALFVHFSPACPESTPSSFLLDQTTTTNRRSDLVHETFASIQQIDLVPSLSLLLGLPIPFANLGSISPLLLPTMSPLELTTALALNAAQVWKYFVAYNQVHRALPLQELQPALDMAVEAWKEALQKKEEEDLVVQAAMLFKSFLQQALETGQLVWTTFDTVGMVCGAVVLAIALIWSSQLLMPQRQEVPQRVLSPSSQLPECLAAVVFLIFQCGMLTFSNSYILQEEHTTMFCLAVLCLMVGRRLYVENNPLWKWAVLLPLTARLSELFVAGHGLDPSTGQYLAHSASLFLPSLGILGFFRYKLYETSRDGYNAAVDILVVICLAFSWWEKHLPDDTRNGYRASTMALALVFPSSVWKSFVTFGCRRCSASQFQRNLMDMFAKLVLAIVCVTGPSAATSLVLYSLQASITYRLSLDTSSSRVSCVLVTTIWRLVTRHIFFATNHGCFFNRLQYSAAFVATEEFYFVVGGISLFINTFGYEILGLLMARLCTFHHANVWRLHGVLQLVEALASCISVSILRRHLMVWDIYAPHFIWVSVFTTLHCVGQVLASLGTPRRKKTNIS